MLGPLSKTPSVCNRYFGAKDWSLLGLVFRGKTSTAGYHRHSKLLSRANAIKFEPLIAMTEASFSSNSDKLKKYNLSIIKPDVTDLPPEIVVHEKCLLDTKTGLKVTLIKHEEVTYVVFGCIYSANPELWTLKDQLEVVKWQYRASVSNVIGTEAKLYNQAEDIFLKIKARHRHVRLVGGCLGGSIASYVGLRQSVSTTTINGLPIGVGLQEKIGRKKLENADNLVKHFIVQGDQIADNRILNIIDKILSFIGIRTPGNFGVKYSIPSGFKSAKKTHELVRESLKIYCK